MSNYWEEEEEDPQVEETLPHRTARRTRRDSGGQSNWYLLTGLILGIALGLLFSWVVSPVKYVDTDPSSLAANYKDEYRRTIALAYRATGNLERARERMKLVDQDGAIQELAAQAQRMLADNQPAQEARALAVLAADMGKPDSIRSTPSTQAVSQLTPQETLGEDTPEPEQTATLAVENAIQTPTRILPTNTPAATRTPMPTFTARPTSTPIRVLNAPFTLKSRNQICNGSVPPGLIQILVYNAEGEPLPGVRITITWQGGEDNFYTGLAQEISPGYADFATTVGQNYVLRVGEASRTIDDLKANTNCGEKLEFTQQSSPSN